MTKARQICAVVLFGLILTGCGLVQAGIGQTEDNHKKSEGWRIQEDCTEITEGMAEEIYQKVLGLEQELYAGREAVENSRIVFLNEETAGAEITVRAVFETDLTGIRKPEDDPMIVGMCEARDTLATEQERKAAEEYIEGWLLELRPQYQKTERVPMDIMIKLAKENRKEYRLYYPLREASKETLVPLEQYALENWKEDEEAKRQMGRDRLLESVEIDEGLEQSLDNQ